MKKKIIHTLLALCLLLPPASSALADSGGTVGATSVSEAGIAFIEEFEGFSEYAYESSSGWYIGYGTCCAQGDYPGGISEETAQGLLRDTLSGYETKVNSFLDENAEALTQCQYDALLSFTYNLTTSWMAPANRIYDYLADGIENYSETEIVNAFGIWCHTGKTVSATLIRRRLAEAVLFLYGDYGGGDSPEYGYITYDACGGSVPHDIYFYRCGEPCGELPEPELAGSTFCGWFTDGGRKMAPEDIVSGNLAVHAVWNGEAADAAVFADVGPNDWFYRYVSDLNLNGIVSGYPDGTFRPGCSVTCGEALKLILLAAGFGAQAPTSSHWASGYLDLAVSNGFAGRDEIGGLDSPISRLLTARISAKALGLGKSDITTPFSDTVDGYVLSLYEADILNGSSEGDELLFRPGDALSRAEISTVVWRIGAYLES